MGFHERLRFELLQACGDLEREQLGKAYLATGYPGWPSGS